MNVVLWARVSSREQREGYSIDAQLRAMRDRAQRENWNVINEFVVAESAKRGAERVAFNQMFGWVQKNTQKHKINAIVAHKLDRVCRNMRDAVRLQELEDTLGVKLAFIDNEFGPGAAGALSFNVMAAVAQYYSDNLRAEVLKGMDEKVRQGWPTGLAPYGYINVDDKEEPIVPHPEKSRAIVRMFELYSTGKYTFKSLADKLLNEGHVFRASQPRFNRTALSHILNNRFYIGEIKRKDKYYPGKHKILIDRQTFELCQDILNGKNRRFGNTNIALSGGLFRCAHCGKAMTGERIRKKLKGGGYNEHIYFRCANNHPDADHPKIRWRQDVLEEAVVKDLELLRMPPEYADWFRKALTAAFANINEAASRQQKAFQKRKTELENMQERLLNGYLAGVIDQAIFENKSNALKNELATLTQSTENSRNFDLSKGNNAIQLFDFSQKAADLWRSSNNALKRDLLESLSLNRAVSDVSLCITKRKPFDILAKRPKFEKSRGDRT
ncbi:MAG: recombinase family protein [Planctomycetes bacterium]|nr:recombinase family protein [Planctomycetota bacterium]